MYSNNSPSIIKLFKLNESCCLNISAAKKAADICEARGFKIYAAKDDYDSNYTSIYRYSDVSDDKFWEIYHELMAN
jgi:hypothetical protein